VGAGADDRCRTRLYAVREWSQLDDLPSDGMNFLAPTNLAPGRWCCTPNTSAEQLGYFDRETDAY